MPRTIHSRGSGDEIREAGKDAVKMKPVAGVTPVPAGANATTIKATNRQKNDE